MPTSERQKPSEPSERHFLDGRMRKHGVVDLRRHPPKAHGPALVANGRDPVPAKGPAAVGIHVSDDDGVRLPAVVGAREGVVGVDGVVPVVERLHPVVVELKVPAAARRRANADAQRGIRAESAQKHRTCKKLIIAMRKIESCCTSNQQTRCVGSDGRNGWMVDG
eukprot:294328-Pleurochrysis_carterae.AAC.3